MTPVLGGGGEEGGERGEAERYDISPKEVDMDVRWMSIFSLIQGRSSFSSSRGGELVEEGGGREGEGEEEEGEGAFKGMSEQAEMKRRVERDSKE